MPIYEYQCDECGKQYEVMQKFSDEPLHTCPECGGALHKLISQTSFVLKGTGWYLTDYARHQQTKNEQPNTKSAATNETKTESKEKTKTEAKEEVTAKK
jgi:putative FmdB family regulatory protein